MSETLTDSEQNEDVDLSAPRQKTLEGDLGSKTPKQANDDPSPPSEAPVTNEQPNYSVFTHWEKIGIVLGTAAGAFFSPLTAQIYLPALNVLASEFHVSVSKINLTVTTYMIFQGLTPMFIGSFADSIGRRPAYFICFVIYIAANIGCALAPSYTALLILRMLQSAGSSTTVALCQAVVSDIITSAERGQYVGYTALPVLLAPAIGPVLGGILSQFLGWRWIFWILAILAGFVLIIHAFFLPETCREIVGDGSTQPHPAYRTLWQLCNDFLRERKRQASRNENAIGSALAQMPSRTSTRRSLHLKKFNVLKSLNILFEKEMFLLLSYSSIVFAGFYCIATSMPPQLAQNYGFDDIKVGLMYLPMAGGSGIAAFVNGRLINWNYRRHCKIQGVPFERSKQQDLAGFPIERARLEVGIPLLALATTVIFSWGWVLQYRAHVAVPCVLLFLIGWGLVGFNNTTNVLLIDVNPGNAGAATASNNLTRCLVGAAATALIGPMINGIGTGWAFMIIGALYVIFSPALLVIMRNGVRWRQESKAKKLSRKLARQARE